MTLKSVLQYALHCEIIKIKKTGKEIRGIKLRVQTTTNEFLKKKKITKGENSVKRIDLFSIDTCHEVIIDKEREAYMVDE